MNVPKILDGLAAWLTCHLTSLVYLPQLNRVTLRYPQYFWELHLWACQTIFVFVRQSFSSRWVSKSKPPFKGCFYLSSSRIASCVGTAGTVMWCLLLMRPCCVALGRVLIWIMCPDWFEELCQSHLILVQWLPQVGFDSPVAGDQYYYQMPIRPKPPWLDSGTG